MAMGLAAGGMSAGQLLIVPLATLLTYTYGWRSSFLWLGIGLVVLIVPVGLWLPPDTPEQRGLRPLGATGPRPAAADIAARQHAGRGSGSEGARRLPFWRLLGSFFVGGFPTHGLGIH